MIRVGLLHTPALDGDAGEAIRRLLVRELAPFAVLQEGYAVEQRNWVEDILCRWCDEEELDLILTIGGTMPAPGPGGREILPDVTAHVVERLLPGLPEAMRAHAGESTELALLDRGIAGIRGRTLLINLPAGAGPALLFFEAVVHLVKPVLAHLREDTSAPHMRDEIELVQEDAENVDMLEVQDDNLAETAKEEGAPTGESSAWIHSGSVTNEPPNPSKLDAGEFAEFLKRRKD